MKKISLALSVLLIASAVSAQNAYDTTAPFRRFPTIPAFKLLETDSVSFFTKDKLKKDKPVLILVFNPECDHCKQEVEAIIKHKDDLKKVQIVMASMSQYPPMKDFFTRYKLSEIKNITVGQDFQYLLPTFYRIRTLPYLAMYDKKGKLLSTFEGTMKIEDLVAVFK